MKKRLIWLGVILVVLCLAVIAVVVPSVRSWVRDSSAFGSMYSWLRTNLYDIYYALRYGARRFAYVSNILRTVSALVTFILWHVPEVNDKTMRPISVKQKPTIKSENGKPSIMVVEENKEDN